MSKIHKGDTVRHDFSGEIGKVVNIRNKNPYRYCVSWNGKIGCDWYKRDVLLKVEAKDGE